MITQPLLQAKVSLGSRRAFVALGDAFGEVGPSAQATSAIAPTSTAMRATAGGMTRRENMKRSMNRERPMYQRGR